MRAGGARRPGTAETAGPEAGAAVRAMPHFTVVPVDGPRRGDYDNLEGLSWVDYGERAEREDSDGEGAPGGSLGGDRGAGHAGSTLTDTWPGRAHVDAGPTFLSLSRRHHSLAPRAQTRSFRAPAPAVGPPSQPQLLPCGPQAGAADVADEGGQASGAAGLMNSSKLPSLAPPGWEHSRIPDPQPLHLL